MPILLVTMAVVPSPVVAAALNPVAAIVPSTAHLVPVVMPLASACCLVIAPPVLPIILGKSTTR